MAELERFALRARHGGTRTIRTAGGWGAFRGRSLRGLSWRVAEPFRVGDGRKPFLVAVSFWPDGLGHPGKIRRDAIRSSRSRTLAVVRPPLHRESEARRLRCLRLRFRRRAWRGSASRGRV